MAARQTPALLYKVSGQSLALRFPHGRPTSATFAVFRAFVDVDDSNVTPEFSGAAALDTVNTTLTAAAGLGQADPQLVVPTSLVALATATDYQLSQNGVFEWVQLVEITGSFARTRYPLKYAYATGAALASTWLTAAVDNTWIADISKISDLSDTYPDFRVKWTVVYGGQTYITYSFFDVVRAEVRHTVELDDLNSRAPGLRDSLPTEYDVEDGRPLVDTAWRRVRSHLQAMNIQVDAIREDEVIDELVILMAMRTLAEGGWRPPSFQGDYLKLTTDNYNTFFEQHFSVTLKHRLDLQLGPLNRSTALPLLNMPWVRK